MKQFIFHIGMHKCASTTLQEYVFKHEPGAIGTHKNLDPKINFGRQFQFLAPVGGRQYGSVKKASDWVKHVNNYYGDNYPQIKRFIVSNEFLCQSNKLSNRPIIKFLNAINQNVFDGNNIKVIIVFRNQSEMMASEYAQNSGLNFNASQRDFEKWVATRLNRTNKAISILDWGGWTKNLVDTFGRDNVCILLLEEMHKLGFWENLISFIDAREISAEELHENNTKAKKNIRKIDKKTWRLTPFDLEKKAKVDMWKIQNFMRGIGLQGDLMDKIMGNSIQMRIKHLKLLGYKDKPLIDSKISLTPEIESKIRNGFHDSNAVLSSILGRNISELGY